MAAFGLSDIIFKGKDREGGKLRDLVSPEFKYSILQYPKDLGNFDKAHYIVFYIRSQKNSKYQYPAQPDDSSISDSQVKAIIDKRAFKTTNLTTDSIALYMPDTLHFTYSQSYSDLNIGYEPFGKAFAALRSIADAYRNTGGHNIENTTYTIAKAGVQAAVPYGINRVIKGASGAIGSNSAEGISTAIVGAENPMLELIYRSPNFRTFQFEFMFYPRDEGEALMVQNILERLRFHSAPEYLKENVGFLIPPSEFDIRFYYAGKQNPNIPPIATCVLTSIDINYAPRGFSAYELWGDDTPSLGGTGMPVAIQLILQFQEVTYLVKEDFNQA